MDVLITVLMKTPIYIRSLIIKDKEKIDLQSYLFIISVSLFFSSFFITQNTQKLIFHFTVTWVFKKVKLKVIFHYHIVNPFRSLFFFLLSKYSFQMHWH